MRMIQVLIQMASINKNIASDFIFVHILHEPRHEKSNKCAMT